MKSMMTKGGLCFCLLLVLCLALGTEALGNGALSHIQRQQARTRGRQQRAAPQTREREGAGVPTSDAWNDNDRAALIEEMRRTHPVRTGHDMPAEEMHEFLQHRANLLFRTLDVNRDRLVTAEDVKDREAVAALHKYMPGVSPQQFTAFIQEADEDGDGGLDNDEFLAALSVGVHRAARHADVQSLLETASQSQSRRRGHHGGRSSDYLGRNRQGFISTMYNYQNARRSDDDGQMSQPSASNNPLEDVMVAASNGRPFEEARFTEVRAGGDEGCVLCQYVLERCETNVKSSGVIPAMTGVNLDGVYLELESHTSGRDVDSDSMLPSAAAPNRKEEANGDNKEDTRMRHEQADREFVSLVETGSSAGYSPMDVAGAAVIGSTRQSTRYQRQLERQKYNEIYRVVDISLDDVCEQGMPNLFYQYCKQIYKAQSDVVDGLRYQYRAADICYKIKMCGPGSYITAGIHSRYKGPPLAQQAPQE